MTTTTKAAPLAALHLLGELPEVHWMIGDDLCDCTFQRIGEWTSPYLGATLRIRLCCLFKELTKDYPQFVQEIPAYYDENRHKWVKEPRQWDSDEMDMPVAVWYRQLARQTGKSLDQIRRDYDMRKHERPKKISKAERKRRQDLAAPTQAEVDHALHERLKASGWEL